jgi:Protein of unknown function (DUF559)
VTLVCRDAEDVVRLAVRHHRVRLSGQPVLSVVAGPPRLAARLMIEVDAELARETAAVSSAGGLIASWAASVARSPRVRARLAALAGEHGLAGKRTAFDWRRVIASATGHDAEQAAHLVQAIARADGRSLARLVAPADRLDDAALRWLSRLIGPRALPGVRAVIGKAESVSAAVEGLLGFFALVPLATELVAPWPAVEEWLGGGDSRARALARDGLVRLPPGAPGKAKDSRGHYRSWPEKLLHEELQRHPDSEGMFAPNERVAVRFGRDGAEVDLLCDEHRVAVEIDGWHHFRRADSYRRDRRKEVALQQHGYLVYRVLAEDITDDPAGVAAKIREVVRSRLRLRHQQGGSG